MLSKIKKTLWGDVSAAEFKHFGLLSATFFFVIGSYWMLRGLKNAFFMHLVGPDFLPLAKIVSIVSLIAILIFYNKLVDLLEKTKLLYLMTGIYGTSFVVLAFFLHNPTMAGTWIGWPLYVLIESFGSIVIPLFWAYVASVTDAQKAKKGYPIVVTGAQLGSMLGCLLVMTQAESLGAAGLVALGGLGVFVIPVLIYFFHKNHVTTVVEQKDTKKKPTGLLEGLKLLLSKPYLMGILVVSTVYEVIGTMFDFLMNKSAFQLYGSLEQVAKFLATYGLVTNALSFVFALLGTSFFIRRFGLTKCLVAYPSMIVILVLAVWQFPSLWMFFAAQVALKGLSYALNNPCKEIMYVPTSKDVKFKAKSWIDAQGGRSGKALGSLITGGFPVIGDLLLYGSLISLGVIAAWIPIAYMVGQKNQSLVESGDIIE
jgi:AAA family ATP:ADP antiporter